MKLQTLDFVSSSNDSIEKLERHFLKKNRTAALIKKQVTRVKKNILTTCFSSIFRSFVIIRNFIQRQNFLVGIKSSMIFSFHTLTIRILID